MNTVQIRPVSAADYAQWLALWQAYLHFYETRLADEVTASTWQRMLDEHEPTHAALAWVDGQAVGMVNFIFHRSNWSIEDSCYLQDLFVAPGQRGNGVGRQLIEYVYAGAAEHGSHKVHWLTHETNATAIRLYEQVAERGGFIQFRKTF
ncbi:GNAT family N-acetyltransferase [Pseudomonas sp. DTU_2021_1001937_2_SI_NGA_ILE_001]|uniref:GNAT family N-acetyltransferase n=1 Tax=Pseudomonas sp. DTU_2021_1001937_2_SI_NGA_ILE_001 TaxID=3077589 RepID=UPI0028FC12D1|nr:GNAT family N-acetyltransferase [Pseudomonas sp. DTU_2021_1001937_2_SI_NGA_ILE_001]WNW12542.1 GNAT family N-acetyltransferase [Pseudomonas sp. DTU_2021_1001937_2_SI_NGA_ILE_001]